MFIAHEISLHDLHDDMSGIFHHINFQFQLNPVSPGIDVQFPHNFGGDIPRIPSLSCECNSSFQHYLFWPPSHLIGAVQSRIQGHNNQLGFWCRKVLCTHVGWSYSRYLYHSASTKNMILLSTAIPVYHSAPWFLVWKSPFCVGVEYIKVYYQSFDSGRNVLLHGDILLVIIPFELSNDHISFSFLQYF